jgi:catechol 2,3-dioxygenase-like lactoylglutathione lyase family enzyme
MSEVIGTTDLPLGTISQDRIMLIVEVENVDKTFQEFTKKGVVFTLPPQDMPGWGIRSAYLRDPDGNLIELSSALDQSKWSEGLVEANEKYSQE